MGVMGREGFGGRGCVSLANLDDLSASITAFAVGN